MTGIVLFVEGNGEVDAAPMLVKRLISDQGDWRGISLDPSPFRAGAVTKLMKDDFQDWKRLLRAALQRSNVGAVLLILDGDIDKVGGEEFCAFKIAKSLAGAATQVGAGSTFSVAIVFAMQEFETWLIAGVASLAGKQLPDGRLIDPDASAPDADLEEGPRDAKGWLAKVVKGGYRPTRDQAALSKLVDLDVIRARRLRSFRRLESAISK